MRARDVAKDINLKISIYASSLFRRWFVSNVLLWGSSWQKLLVNSYSVETTIDKNMVFAQRIDRSLKLANKKQNQTDHHRTSSARVLRNNTRQRRRNEYATNQPLVQENAGSFDRKRPIQLQFKVSPHPLLKQCKAKKCEHRPFVPTSFIRKQNKTQPDPTFVKLYDFY